jgi:hypothetical protein
VSLLALLDGRVEVGSDDWELSGIVSTVSQEVRTWTLHQLWGRTEGAARETEERAGLRAVAVEEGKATASAQKVERVAKRLPSYVERNGPATKGEFRSHLGRADRDALDGAVQLALDEGWLIGPEESEGKFGLGPRWGRPGHLDIQNADA